MKAYAYIVKRIIITAILALCLFPGMMPPAASASALDTPVKTTNMSKHFYSYGRWAKPINSYLVDNSDNTFTRVEYTGESVAVEIYDADLNFVSGQLLELELPIFGGYYSGSDSNFLIVGQENPDEDDTREVIRVIRYTKDWKRISSASLRGANTVEPFRSGSLRCTEYNGYLYVRTGHKMYTHTDGINHQANLTFNVRLSDMEITDSFYDISSTIDGYVSHSFNQFIGVAGGRLYAVDHGDGEPRAVTLFRYVQPAGKDRFTLKGYWSDDSDHFYGRNVDRVDVLPIMGEYGDNDTGVYVGGFELSDSHGLVAGCTVAQDENFVYYYQRNVFVAATSLKDFSSGGTTLRYLTSYDTGAETVGISMPHLVKLNSDRYMIFWTEDKTTLCWGFLNGSGEPQGQIYKTSGRISDCQPIVFGGKVLWYITNESAPHFLWIDLSDPQQLHHQHIYDYRYTTDPTDTQPGIIEGTCYVCGGASETVTVPAIGGSDEFVIHAITYDPTCKWKGYGFYKWIYGPDYGEGQRVFFGEVPPLGHDYDTETIFPTCTENGRRTLTCNRCGEVEKTVLKATGHNYKTVTVDATCTQDGSKTSTCTLCQDVQTEILPAMGHDNEVVDHPPTCTEPGYMTYTCRTCGHVINGHYASATGHNYKTVTVDATCTQDGSKTSTCTLCQDVQTEILPATGHDNEVVDHPPTCTEPGYMTYTCRTCGYVITGHYASAIGHQYTLYVMRATCTNGGYLQYMCDNCGYNYKVNETPATGHNYVGGICTSCNRKDPDYVPPSINLMYPTLTFEDEILLNVYYTTSGLGVVVEMGLLTFDKDVTQADVTVAQTVIPGSYWLEEEGIHCSTTRGIAPKALGDEIYFAIYAKCADGTYCYSRPVSYSPKTYAYAQLSTGTTEMKQLVVAMLNYGAAAQTYFGYRTDSLINAGLTADQTALVEAYRSDMIAAIASPSAAKQGAFVKNGGFSGRYPTVSFEGAFCINYYCTPSTIPEGGITMYYWSAQDYDANDVLTTENATDVIPMVPEGGVYHGVVEGIAAKDLDKGIYVCFSYCDGTTTYSSGVLAYSIGTYCGVQANGSNTTTTLAQATAVYGYYAKNLFHQ